MYVCIYVCMATYIHIYDSMSHVQIEDKRSTCDCAALWTRLRPCSHATSRCMRIKLSSSTLVTLCTRWNKRVSRPLCPCGRFGRRCSLITRYSWALSECAPFLLSTGTSFHQLSTASCMSLLSLLVQKYKYWRSSCTRETCHGPRRPYRLVIPWLELRLVLQLSCHIFILSCAWVWIKHKTSERFEWVAEGI